jgi:hypothetical protein
VNESETLIADALRDIADQAAAPRPLAGPAWRAGRRRRLLGTAAASTAAAAAAITIAVAVSLATTGGPGSLNQGGALIEPSAAGHVGLRAPIQFEQVASTSDRPCAAGADKIPGPAPAACVHLTGTGMTITRIESAQVQRIPQGGYALDIRLTPADSRVFVALTRKLAGLHGPHNEFAVIAGGRVLALPKVEAPMTVGRVQINGFSGRAQAEHLLKGLPR